MRRILMAYESDKKNMNKSDNKKSNYANFDECIDRAKNSGKNQTRTDAYAEGDGYLGVDDLDRIRRRKLK